MIRRYQRLFGAGERPHPDVSPHIDQLTCLQRILSDNGTPYVDFAVFGPHATRKTHKMRLSGYVWGPNGGLVPLEIPGPPDLETWLMCWSVRLGRVGQLPR